MATKKRQDGDKAGVGLRPDGGPRRVAEPRDGGIAHV